MTKQFKYALIAAATVVVLILIFLPKNSAQSKSKSLAACLAEKGVVMYGSDTCDQCKNQKKILGNDFEDINYFNCDFHLKTCTDRGITVYPVWSYGNNVLVGVQSLKSLAAFAGCEVNNTQHA